MKFSEPQLVYFSQPRCAWVLTSAGITVRPVRSTTLAAGGAGTSPAFPTRTITSPRTRNAASSMTRPSPTITRPPVNSRTTAPDAAGSAGCAATSPAMPVRSASPTTSVAWRRTLRLPADPDIDAAPKGFPHMTLTSRRSRWTRSQHAGCALALPATAPRSHGATSATRRGTSTSSPAAACRAAAARRRRRAGAPAPPASAASGSAWPRRGRAGPGPSRG